MTLFDDEKKEQETPVRYVAEYKEID